MVDEETGVKFFVSVKTAAAEAGRKASGAAASAGSSGAPKARKDPFETPEQALVIEPDLTPTHYLQLNKFPIVDDHLLIVTKQFKYQTDVPDLDDFKALGATLREVDGFVFFNCGALSGASQPHKHFQLLPRDALKRSAGAQLTHEIPMEALIDGMLPPGSAEDLVPHRPPPPFSSSAISAVRLPADWLEREDGAERALQAYEMLLADAGLPIDRDGEDHCHDTERPSHNMVMTRSWMLVAGRASEASKETGIGCNGCGFGGFFLLRDASQLPVLQRRGPSMALVDVCRGRSLL